MWVVDDCWLLAVLLLALTLRHSWDIILLRCLHLHLWHLLPVLQFSDWHGPEAKFNWFRRWGRSQHIWRLKSLFIFRREHECGQMQLFYTCFIWSRWRYPRGLHPHFKDDRRQCQRWNCVIITQVYMTYIKEHAFQHNMVPFQAEIPSAPQAPFPYVSSPLHLACSQP